MTKKELLELVQNVYDRLGELESSLDYAIDDLKKMQRKFEDVPTDVEDITEE